MDTGFRKRSCSTDNLERDDDSKKSHLALGLEMLGELQALRLVVRADALAVKRLGTRQHRLVDEPADDLPVFEDERHFARAHLEHGAAALPARARIAEARIEEARIVHAEFADQRIERHHL